jgi:hypothetical protein
MPQRATFMSSLRVRWLFRGVNNAISTLSCVMIDQRCFLIDLLHASIITQLCYYQVNLSLLMLAMIVVHETGYLKRFRPIS